MQPEEEFDAFRNFKFKESEDMAMTLTETQRIALLGGSKSLKDVLKVKPQSFGKKNSEMTVLRSKALLAPPQKP